MTSEFQSALEHLRASDPVLERIIASVGPCGIRFRAPRFEALARSIIAQQVSGAAARTMCRRLVEACGGRIPPAAVLALSPEQMRACGLSGQKSRYIRDLAEHTRSRRLRFGHLHTLSDEQVIEVLTAVKGIGVWTAHMFLIFALRRPDVLPVGDLGIRAAIKRAYGLEELPDAASMERIAQAWRPYCSIACWYLWRSLEGDANL